MPDPLFTVTGLKLTLPDLNARPLFGTPPNITILDHLSFEIQRGLITGIVGESGSGKSTLGRCLVRLLKPTAGQILFDGHNITHASETELLPHRRNLQMIFQDPLSSLNPRRTIGSIVAAPLRNPINATNGNPTDLARQALIRVGLGDDFIHRYPHQLSGGERQRVGIARAIALNPKFILADEIVSGLDVSTQARIIAMLEQLVSELNLTMVFISHDLSIMRRLCARIIVMYHGKIVEHGEATSLFADPKHPHTQALRNAVLIPEINAARLL